MWVPPGVSKQHLQQQPSVTMPAVLAQGPPVTSGLTGFYVGDSYNATENQWMDISGLGNHANTTGNITRMPLGINGEDYLRGLTTSTVALPQTFVGDSYTFFHVCRCAAGNPAAGLNLQRPTAAAGPPQSSTRHSVACNCATVEPQPAAASTTSTLSPPATRYPPASTTWQRIWDLRSAGGHNYLSGFVQGIAGVAVHSGAAIGGAVNLQGSWVLSVDQVRWALGAR
jgi:hypothetical protein